SELLGALLENPAPSPEHPAGASKIPTAVLEHRTPLSKIRRPRRNIRCGLPKIRRGLPKIRRGLPKIRRGLPKIRRGLPKIQRPLPSVQRGLPNCGAPSRSFGAGVENSTATSNFGRETARFRRWWNLALEVPATHSFLLTGRSTGHAAPKEVVLEEEVARRPR